MIDRSNAQIGRGLINQNPEEVERLKLQLQEAQKALEGNSMLLLIEEHLARERNQLRTLIDNIPDYIYFKDTKSRFIDANKATVRIMKCKDREELIGKNDFEFYPKEFAEKFYSDEQKILTNGKSRIDIEESIVDERGRSRTLLTSKVLLRNKHGKIIGLVGIGRDITERKQAEEILKRDNETIEKILEERTHKLLEVQAEFDRAKRMSDMGTLAAMMAHELRNPLGIIQLSIHNLKKDKDLAGNKHLKNIEMKISEGNRIIDDLLSYSRTKSPSPESVDLFALLDECIESCQIRFHDHAIAIEKHYDTSVNSIEIDPYQMKQVFINILNNAIQAFVKKIGKIDVTVDGGNKFVTVSFKDNGVGISKEDLDKIFLPFFTRKSRGTGLGLAVCNEIVGLHGGKIDVKSHPGEGTEFIITLPAKNHSK